MPILSTPPQAFNVSTMAVCSRFTNKKLSYLSQQSMRLSQGQYINILIANQVLLETSSGRNSSWQAFVSVICLESFFLDTSADEYHFSTSNNTNKLKTQLLSLTEQV